MVYQTTLNSEVSYTGVGLHSGVDVHMTLQPAPANTGIVFVRSDLPGMPRIEAKAANVTSTVRATTIEANGIKLFTIEHLMSAFYAMGIDNCLVLIDAEEPPVADGSSKVFAELMAKAGIKVLDALRREIVIDRLYRVDDGDKFILAVPYDGFRVSFTSINPHPLIGIQYGNYEITPESYLSEVAPARTIAYEAEIDALREMGLGLGGTLENVIVYNDDGWMNELRYPDELVRHKILDIVGDLRLTGFIRGHIIAVKSGHALNTTMAKLLAEEFKG
ncbi:UDP-3-O-acyl-N-acetylglucosamine deacetylase [Anaerovibrio sp.]|uniref:UDP-3-O-acyl-N-acetylglucosamine deacetylase n=1 Tax=Anaerovibrio sp. TaxID=1872532 RepID=UPI0025C5BB45|nr:UDP-3-O-acyl-N-acetylglucosamine deacetylase [Anaerovibrio sp.]MBR2142421.1 UDP-3-O-[3-hydroxymyristoyl] N-acetylglucosamine deacetylase [Anaerovibrio sp.]